MAIEGRNQDEAKTPTGGEGLSRHHLIALACLDEAGKLTTSSLEREMKAMGCSWADASLQDVICKLTTHGHATGLWSRGELTLRITERGRRAWGESISGS